MSRYELACTKTGENGSTVLRVTLTDTTTGRVFDPVDVTRAEIKTGAEQIASDMGVSSSDEVERRLAEEFDADEPLPIPEVLDKRDPMPIARKFLRDGYGHADACRLRLAGDVLYEFVGPAYIERDPMELRSRGYAWAERQRVVKKGPDGEEVQSPFKPTRADIDNLLDAVRAQTHTPHRPPAWLKGGDSKPDPAHLLVAPNGVFHLHHGGASLVCPPTPNLFATNAIGYPFDQNAPEPVALFKFLSELWGDDEQCIQLLQEWFGYVLTADTSLQKILMLIGPPRSGKGTLMRVLMHLIGVENACAPTLAGIGTNFGLWPMIDKRLAVVSDARLSNRTDQGIVTERLLSISGEDFITIDRKNRTPLTLKLSARIVLCTNELPRLADASGALANRFLILPLTKSYLGHEDPRLTEKLLAELPGILRWAVEGWQRLQARGHFLQPDSGRQAIEEMAELSSPITAFISECCVVQPGQRVQVHDLFEAWTAWCKEQGRESAGNVQVFGRDLRAAKPGIVRRQQTIDDKRVGVFNGIGLTLATIESLNVARANAEYRASRWGAPA